MSIRRLLVILAALSVLAPAVTWAAFKPVRVLAPELLGLHCSSTGVCVDDVRRIAEAEALRDEAAAFVSARVGPLGSVPRVVFCSTQACAKAYGFTGQGAYNVGLAGVVVGPRGWHPHFVRHEFIHRLQCERFGVFDVWLSKPDWFLEGMAYSLSEDPRRPLPEPWQGWRHRFEGWYAGVGPQQLWRAAAAL